MDDNRYNGQYNDDLYTPQDVSFSYIDSEDKNDSFTPPKKKSGGKIFLAMLLVLCMTLGVSAASIGGYVWLTERRGGAPTEVDGGNRVIYTLASKEGDLTPQEIFVKAAPWVVSITSQVPSYYGVSTSTGTGIIMKSDGYIITNHHVIDGAQSVTVRLGDGKEYPADIVGSEAKTDIAVLKIAADGLTAAEFGSSAELVTGDTAIVIGNPLGLSFAETMTMGIISSPEREIKLDQYMMSLIQIDAAINPGNSGGPLINSRGQVVGVVNAKIADQKVEGIGFAIPIDKALSIAGDLIDYGYVAGRPMLGITVQSITEQQAYYYGYEAGITVTEVTTGSPADIGGVKAGDKILAFNGVEVSDSEELNFQKEKCSVGDTITLTVERNGEKLELSITLTAGTVA